ncbi:hypothetical protein AB3X52_11310 [Nocardioides sp. DS6]|uniref:Uncharacterized protein n=1 Tax=Nocardioides eburneus TaxID=3231482 RepID=A0ABV3T0J5_9ACTN
MARESAGKSARKKTAGAFDIRNVIGALLSVYGIILILVFAFVGNDAKGDKHDNLWAGLVMLVVGLVFLAWAWLRPVVVKEVPESEKTPPVQ